MHGHAHTCPVYSRHPCSQDTPCIHIQAQHHVHHTHTYTQTYTHLHTSVRTPTCMCSIPTSIVHTCTLAYYVHHIYTTRHATCGHTPPQVRMLPTRRTTRINHAPPTPALNPRKARGPSGLKGAPPLTRRAPWVQRGLGPTAGGRPGLSTPSSRSPGQQGRDRAAADAGLLDPGTPTWCMSAPAPCTLQRDPVKPLIFYPVHGIHFHMFPFLFS